jgi:hypothetical protein
VHVVGRVTFIPGDAVDRSLANVGIENADVLVSPLAHPLEGDVVDLDALGLFST